ncbi:MAG: hypothetical protein QOJ35_3094 [Solirubrobacteraceae bacterium]|jgi:hypothetical protein|nr:hypothetical protein [Solirubrobacteraceae bacterium]
MQSKVVYVELLHEGVEAWAPVEAEQMDSDTYVLPGRPPEDQEWAFPPGSRVVCERRGEDLFAVRLAA